MKPKTVALFCKQICQKKKKIIHHLTLSSVFWVKQKTWVADFGSDFQTMRFVLVLGVHRLAEKTISEHERVRLWVCVCLWEKEKKRERERERENNIRNMLKISDYNCLLSLCPCLHPYPYPKTQTSNPTLPSTLQRLNPTMSLESSVAPTLVEELSKNIQIFVITETKAAWRWRIYCGL